ncbi:MAG: hypothetical protein QNL87_02660, partial [Gammaproteobacteria bacterium]|nr:hypothetical protein [Gammaproteobacteria bacterium]
MNLCMGLEVRLASMALLVTTTLLAGFPAVADELIMKDGSRLLGKVVKEDEGGTLNFETSYAGTIKVKWSEIIELIADEPIVVLLKNRETRVLTNAKNTGAGVVIADESGSTETLFPSEVAYVNPEPWRLGKGMRWTGNVNVV